MTLQVCCASLVNIALQPLSVSQFSRCKVIQAINHRNHRQPLACEPCIYILVQLLLDVQRLNTGYHSHTRVKHRKDVHLHSLSTLVDQAPGVRMFHWSK